MIEVKKLLRPVSSGNPSGESLKYSVAYDQIKAARQEDDSDLPQGIWQRKLKKADWQEVKNICLEILESRSKDLQVGAWLLEACIHLDGFAGLGDGFRVLTALCETFWDTLHPALDPEEPEYRFGPIVWIDEKLTFTLKLIPVTEPKTDDEESYSWSDWENALYQIQATAKATVREKVRKQSAGGEPKERPLQARFMGSMGLTPTEFYVDLSRNLSVALAEVDRFEQVIVNIDKTQEGALHHMKDVLRAIEHFAGDVLKERGAGTTIRPEKKMANVDEPVPEPEKNEDEPMPFSPGGPIRSRAQAYQMLAEAAEFLMKTEPHSPTPYLVKRAVAWGNMSLGELLGQVLRNPGEMTELSRLLGLEEFQPKKKAE